MKDDVIIYRESFWQSVLADTYTFGCYAAVVALNHYLLADNRITYFILVVMWLLGVLARGAAKKRIFTNREEAIKFIEARGPQS